MTKPTTTGTPDDRAAEASSSSAGSGPTREQADQPGLPRPCHMPARRDSGRAIRVDREERGGVTPTGEVVGLTRAGVAALLGVSSSTVRRLEERGVLHPHVIDGVHFFDPEEIHRARVARASSAPTDGEAAALAFELLDQGAGLRDIVKRCRVTPERARVLATEWKQMGSGELVISAEVRAELSRALYVRIASGDALLRAVRNVILARDALEREFDDMQDERDAAEDLLSSEQLRELYAARESARSSAPVDSPGDETIKSTTMK
jgi:DNA-binding transcriptional MerR regulator